MRVHAFTEPSFGLLVTGCADPDAALEAAIAEGYDGDMADRYYPDDLDEDATDEQTRAAIGRWLADHPPRVEYGRMIPVAPNDPWYDEGVSWTWRGWPVGGRKRAHGETTAVLFVDW